MSRVTISLEAPLVRQLDHFVLWGGYATRSAAVREMIRFGLDRADILELLPRDGQSKCAAQVSFLCTHHDSAVTAGLIRLLRDNKDLVRASSRVPVNDSQFLESVVLAGLTANVKACCDEMMALKGISSGNVRLIAMDVGGRVLNSPLQSNVPALASVQR